MRSTTSAGVPAAAFLRSSTGSWSMALARRVNCFSSAPTQVTSATVYRSEPGSRPAVSHAARTTSHAVR
jgi:hypothetical protein